MGRCFVIQPFDRGKFDKRYEDVFKPAIIDAGLEPYRVDRDPSASIPIESIESEIRNSEACLADVTTDNPNVWFELGFALASHKEVAIVCSSERTTRFPFDVQHRQITRYETESASDFEKLREGVTERLKAILETRQKLQVIQSMSPVKETEGLSPHEIAALVVIAENSLLPDAVVGSWQIRGDMTQNGYTDLATKLSIDSLCRKNFVSVGIGQHEEGGTYTGYVLSGAGLEWLQANQDKLKLRAEDVGKVIVDDVPF
jgi:hypothetical protein